MAEKTLTERFNTEPHFRRTMLGSFNAAFSKAFTLSLERGDRYNFMMYLYARNKFLRQWSDGNTEMADNIIANQRFGPWNY